MTPTKSNLIYIRQTLTLANQGYSLLDQKRNVLIREAAGLKEKLKELKARTEAQKQSALCAIIRANIEMGQERVETMVVYNAAVPFNLSETAIALDEAYMQFNMLKELIIELAELESTVSRLEADIRKTTKRANALQYIIIPRYESDLKFIEDSLEERDRDAFVRAKLACTNG